MPALDDPVAELDAVEQAFRLEDAAVPADRRGLRRLLYLAELQRFVDLPDPVDDVGLGLVSECLAHLAEGDAVGALVRIVGRDLNLDWERQGLANDIGEAPNLEVAQADIEYLTVDLGRLGLEHGLERTRDVADMDQRTPLPAAAQDDDAPALDGMQG